MQGFTVKHLKPKHQNTVSFLILMETPLQFYLLTVFIFWGVSMSFINFQEAILIPSLLDVCWSLSSHFSVTVNIILAFNIIILAISWYETIVLSCIIVNQNKIYCTSE